LMRIVNFGKIFQVLLVCAHFFLIRAFTIVSRSNTFGFTFITYQRTISLIITLMI
jgi:hypothetical protein